MRFQRLISFLKGLKAPSEYLALRFHENAPPPKRFCTICAHAAQPARQMFGRADIERALWVVLLVLAGIYVSDFIIQHFTSFFLFHWLFKLTSMIGKIFAVLSVAYTLLRISIHTSVCPKCGSTHIIPLDSPRTKDLTGHKP